MSTEEKPDKPEKRSPVLELKDGGAGGKKELLARFLGTVLDTNGNNFLGSGMTFRDWTITGDRLRYDRWYGTQSREESRRRMAYLIKLCAEQERILSESIQATAISERLIEDVIQGDWNGVKMSIETLKFEEERPEYRQETAKRFARFVEIAQEAYDTRPKVFCPVCMRPAPAESIAAFRDGRHVCPWCHIVHDDDGQWLERDKANLSIAKEP